MRIAALTAVLAALGAASAFADGPPPPEGAKPLSQILAQLEQQPDFRYTDEAEFEHGAYKIEYYTKDGVEHKVYIDPVSGKAR
jgi:hypothetical protein